MTIAPVLPVAIVMTVFNEEGSIGTLLDSLAGGCAWPSEIVIADGGSTDATVATVTAWAKKHPEVPVRLLTSPARISIAAGRNLAIERAGQDLIAVIDAGCVADEHWLRNLTAPFFTDSPPDVVAGWYEPIIESHFHKKVARALVPKLQDIRPQSFLPSSRSVAFTRAAWRAAGGYPEHLRFAGEDTVFDLRLKRAGFRFAFSPDAIVRWRLRNDVRSLLRQYYDYGFGDGEERLMVGTYLFRMAACLFPPLMAVTGKGVKDFWLRYRVYLAITAGWLKGLWTTAK